MEAAFYTVEEVSQYLGVNISQAYSLVKSKDFPVVVKRIGRHYRINRKSLEQWASGLLA